MLTHLRPSAISATGSFRRPRLALVTLLLLVGASLPGRAATIGQTSFFTDFTGNSVIQLQPNGTASTLISDLHASSGVAYQYSTGNIFVGSVGDGKIYQFTRDGGNMTVFASGFETPRGMKFNADGNLYVADSTANGGSVFIVDPNGCVEILASGLGNIFDVAFDSSNVGVYVSQVDTGTILFISPSGCVVTFATGVGTPTGLAFDGDDNLYAGNPDTNSISKITPGGEVSTLATGLGSPTGLRLDANGDLLVANSGFNTISQVSLSGSVFPFSNPGTSPYFITVPEPGESALLLALATLGGMLLWRRRRHS